MIFFDRKVDRLEKRIAELEQEVRSMKYKYDSACFMRVGDWNFHHTVIDPRPEISAIQFAKLIADQNGFELQRVYPSQANYILTKKEQQ